MHLCSHNLTFGILGDETLIRFKNRTLVGPLGELYGRMFFSKLPGNCSIRVIPATSKNQTEGSSIMADLWRNKSLDLILFDERVGEYAVGRYAGLTEDTSPVGSMAYGVAQFIAPFSEKLDLTHFLINNIHLPAFGILGFLLIAVLATILPKLTHANGSSRLKSLKTILFRALFVDCNQLPRPALQLMLLTFSLFIFLQLNFLAGSIKTDKVTIPTDEIVDSVSKLVKTPKTLALIDENLRLFEEAPKGSLLKQLSKKEIVMAISSNVLRQMKSNGLHRYHLFGDHNRMVYIMGLVSKHASENGLIAFHKSTDYVETLAIYLMRKNLEEPRKRFINRRLERSLEHGLILVLRKKLEELLKFGAEKNLKIYEDLESMIEDLSQNVSPNVKLDNVQNLFLYPGIFLTLVLLLWATDLFLFKQLQAINRKLVLYLTTVGQVISHRLYLFGGWEPVLGR